ncbi:hypothetical protein GGC63_003549 [Paenibacillus sp. OAS669]|nr:hypothetical protein [Paenibacillus sp. OAS669]
MPRRSLRPPLKSVKNTAKSNPIHGFQQRLEGYTPSEYIGNSSSFIGFSTNQKPPKRAAFFYEVEEASR